MARRRHFGCRQVVSLSSLLEMCASILCTHGCTTPAVTAMQVRFLHKRFLRLDRSSEGTLTADDLVTDDKFTRYNPWFTAFVEKLLHGFGASKSNFTGFLKVRMRRYSSTRLHGRACVCRHDTTELACDVIRSITTKLLLWLSLKWELLNVLLFMPVYADGEPISQWILLRNTGGGAA